MSYCKGGPVKIVPSVDLALSSLKLNTSVLPGARKT